MTLALCSLTAWMVPLSAFSPAPTKRDARTFYLSPYWVGVDSFSPQSRIVRYRRVHEQTIRRMGAKAFGRKARAG